MPRRDGCAYSLPRSIEAARYALTRAKSEAAQHRRDREKAAQLQVLLSSTDDGIITIDRRGHITAYNRIAESLLGVSALQALNAPSIPSCRTTRSADIRRSTARPRLSSTETAGKSP
ncbi:MAG: PAS domain-containing protein, partial [Planctomycetes bacterium]|nr:PAS domain-containing protein [Planctomycetota bacterium]